MQNQHDYDVAIIGSGPGGYVSAIRSAELGFKTVCIEKDATLGGTCLNVGCIPSKALLQSTESFEWINTSAKQHGISVADVKIDFPAVMLRKEGIIKGLTDSISAHFKKLGIVHLHGEAHFTDPHSLEIGALTGKPQKISAKNIIIATGSEPISLPFLPIDEKTIITSTGALSLTQIPKKLVVVGAGAIGVELASVYRRLGSEVVIIEMLDVITPAMDSALSKALLQSLKKQGIEFFLGAKLTAASKDKKGVALKFQHDQKNAEMTADVVLVAVGRRPNTKGLNLQAAGIAVGEKGYIPVDGRFRTSQKHIFAVGDVIEGPMLAHKASQEGIVAVELIAGLPSKMNYISIPNVIYTHPEVASVGFTEAEAKAAGLELCIGTSFFKGNGRARCSGDTDGFVKVVAEATHGRLLGMHIIGAHASELIAEGVLALDKKATLADIANACHAHPTLSETTMEACRNALR